MKAPHADPNGTSASWNKKSCFATLTKLEIALLAAVTVLLTLLTAVCSFWLLYLDGYHVFNEGIAAWKQRNLFLYHSSKLGAQTNASAATVVGFDPSAEHHSRLVCTSRECANIASFFATNLNDKADPCDDFYEYACGNYGLTRELPPTKPLRHTIIDTQSLLHKQIKKVLEAPPSPSDKSWDKLAKDYYQKCLDEDGLAVNGKAAVRSLLQRIGGWPVLQGRNWREFNYGWEEYTAIVLNRTTVNAVLFELTVSHDPSNSSRTVLEFDQPKFGIGSRWPYMGGLNDSMVQNYTEHMVQTAIRMGASEADARAEMLEATELEIKLVDFSSDETQRRDPERSNNPYQLWQLKDQFPFIDFEAYVHRVFDGIAEITPNDTVVIREIDYFKGIQHVLKSSSRRAIANYVGWRVVQLNSPFLPSKDREPFYAFKANQTGMFNAPIPDRWEDCVTLSIMLLDMPVGKLFVENFFDEKFAMPKMTEMTAYLKKTFIEQLDELDWMDVSTKNRAVKKANAIDYKSGYPLHIFNDTWMEQSWGFKPSTKAEPLLDLTLRIKLARTTEELARFKQPVDRSTWYQSPAQVDAFYSPSGNEMVFPAGIMQFPFLSTGVPNYVVYAMVGAVVGHEITHGFDDQGGRYDELGNLNDWWDTSTAEKFYDKADCFVNQYESEKIPEAGGQTLNGRLSLGENIADNAGVKTAYGAYKSWSNENPSVYEPALPGFQNYTADQIFFIAYANNWCSMMRPQHILQLISTDVHAPGRFRAMIPLRNRPEFSTAFNCPKGSPMNPEKKCAIW
uniref:Neprilysin n=1 Tax=Panagrellus redivivus TaxID=6233 RepID=A0A7E4ZZ96_PANRE